MLQNTAMTDETLILTVWHNAGSFTTGIDRLLRSCNELHSYLGEGDLAGDRQVRGIAPGDVRRRGSFGFLIASHDKPLLLVMGRVVCFIGVFYTFGPIPLSRMPLGEVFSGVTMGLGIFAITIYINTIDQKVFYLALDFANGTFGLVGNLWAVCAIVLASLPLIFTIADIMLANNLRDLEADIENHRYTLVYYIGREAGIRLFQGMMLASYAAILLGLLFGLFQWPILLVFLTLPKIRQNLKEHQASLPHPRSFGYSIKNMILFNSSYALGLLLCLLWQLL